MDAPTVHVLLATFNGQRHLREQWDSLRSQEGVRIVLHVADDASTDGTPALLRDLAAQPGGAINRVRWFEAPPRRSAARSFLLLLADTLRAEPGARWFAFCDQDDVWLPRKLAAALEALAGRPAGEPALYGGRTLSVDEAGRELWLSPLFVRPPQFRNALVQSILGGNTMVLNRPAASLLGSCANVDVVSHDWLAYQLVSGAGGHVVYDPRSYVRYRQHGGNEVGTNRGWAAGWRRLRRLLRADYRRWNARNVEALQARRDALLAEHREVLDAFGQAREAPSMARRLRWLRRSQVFRQPGRQQVALWVAAALGRI